MESVRLSRFRPAYASKVALTVPSLSFRKRLCTLPRKFTTCAHRFFRFGCPLLGTLPMLLRDSQVSWCATSLLGCTMHIRMEQHQRHIMCLECFLAIGFWHASASSLTSDDMRGEWSDANKKNIGLCADQPFQKSLHTADAGPMFQCLHTILNQGQHRPIAAMQSRG